MHNVDANQDASDKVIVGTNEPSLEVLFSQSQKQEWAKTGKARVLT